EDARFRAVNVRAVGAQMCFTVQRINGVTSEFEVTLNLAGTHNVLNALAAIAIASELNISDKAIVKALKEFKGVGRRFERYGEVPANDGGKFTLIDDYGHHPAEMQAVINAARGAFPSRRLVLAFQPHRYTRTRDCFEDFVKVLCEADAVLLTEIYSAGEAPIVAADSRALLRAIRVTGKLEPVFVETTGELPQAILQIAKADDVVIVMGAGSIGQVAANTRELAQA
ncbi:MAG TPA: cyanophycin synthetase, partial [Methylophilaceae bacterium]